MKKASDINCPVCQSKKDKEILGSYTSDVAASYFCPTSRSAERNSRLKASIEKLWHSDKADVVHCTECDFGFGHPFVGGDENFYSILHEQKGYPGWKWDYNYTLKNIFNKAEIHKTLDIGAGEGLFLKRLEKSIHKFATEGSPTTRKILQKEGITVFEQLEKVSVEYHQTFDSITIFQVLEHIAEFKPVLETALKLLKTNGILVVSVPELQSMLEQEKYTGCPDMIPNHINKFSKNSLALAISNAGFTVDKIVHEPSYFLKIFNSLHLYLMHKATQKNTLANKVYSIQNKKLRIFFLAILSVPGFFKLLPHVGKLFKGGSILAIAQKK